MPDRTHVTRSSPSSKRESVRTAEEALLAGASHRVDRSDHFLLAPVDLRDLRWRVSTVRNRTKHVGVIGDVGRNGSDDPASLLFGQLHLMCEVGDSQIGCSLRQVTPGLSSLLKPYPSDRSDRANSCSRQRGKCCVHDRPPSVKPQVWRGREAIPAAGPEQVEPWLAMSESAR